MIESAPRGGLLHYAAQLAGGLAAGGHDVVLITARGNELRDRPLAARLRPVLPAAAPARAAPASQLGRALRRAGVGARLLAAGAITIAEVRRGTFDAVLLIDDLNVAPAVLPMLALTALPGGPLLATICHEPRPRNRWAGRGLYVDARALTFLLRRLYRRLDLVFLHGERSRAEFEAAWGATRTAVIPHGHEGMLAPAALAPASEERILFFGDWRRSKGLPELMRAFDRLRARRPAARLTVAGTPYPDGDPAAVRAWASRHGDAVTLIDRYVPIEWLPRLFGAARVVTTPYVAGSQSGVLHLAMSFGRAVVSSDAGELGATVSDGETGRVVPAGDVTALVDALDEVLGDAGEAERLGRAARRRMLAEAGWDRVAAAIMRELRAAAGELAPATGGRAPAAGEPAR